METKFIKHQIGILSDTPPAGILTLLNEQPQFEVTIHRQDRASYYLKNSLYDMLLYCVPATADFTRFMEVVRHHQHITPVIVLMSQPTTDQVVDWMRAGVCAVTDGVNPQRLLNLMTDALQPQPRCQSETIYKDIVDHQTELICRYDADFRLIFVNRAYCDWQGLRAEDLIGQSIAEKIPAEAREQVVSHIQQLTAERPVAVNTHPSILPDGEVHLIEWTDRAIFNDAGEIIEYQGVGRDVTEREDQRRHLEAANAGLTTFRSHLDLILNTMQDALMSFSLPDREVILVSESFSKVYGYPAERFINDPHFFQQVVHPDDLQMTLAAQQRCIRDGHVELDHRII